MRDDRIQYTRHPNLRQHVISRFKNRTNHALPNPDISLATDITPSASLTVAENAIYLVRSKTEPDVSAGRLLSECTGDGAGRCGSKRSLFTAASLATPAHGRWRRRSIRTSP